MKIAILHPFQFRYKRGIERFTWSLIDALASHHVEVGLYTWRWPHAVSWGAAPSNLTLHQPPYFRYFMDRVAVPFTTVGLLRQRYDWVMLFFAGYGEADTIRLQRIFRKQRYCIVFHFPREQVPYRYEEFRRSGLAARADHLIAVGSYVAQGVEEEFERPCTVIENGVDANEFVTSAETRTKARLVLEIPADAPVLITLAALEERKGIQWVIRAMPALLKEHPDLRYYVLGEGPHRGELELEIAQAGVQNHVWLVGNVQATTDVVSYLAAADMGCLLSYGEAFPITLLEYMAMQLPSVTSLHPPFDELVEDSYGKRVNERDTEAVVNVIHELLINPEGQKRMGDAARARVLARYTWSQIADRYYHLLEQ